MIDNLNFSKFCADPFHCHKKKISKDLRVVTEDLITEGNSLKLTMTQKLCKNCISKVIKYNYENVTSELEIPSEPSFDSSKSEIDVDSICEGISGLKEIIRFMTELGQSPVKPISQIGPSYAASKIKRASNELKRKIEDVTGLEVEVEVEVRNK